MNIKTQEYICTFLCKITKTKNITKLLKILLAENVFLCYSFNVRDRKIKILQIKNSKFFKSQKED